ncbi:MAG TPA: alpha/beta fold hydrolase [Caldimonas sp.]|nr:alpha/beta fold hydrolase [Caldimonas sp.]
MRSRSLRLRSLRWAGFVLVGVVAACGAAAAERVQLVAADQVAVFGEVWRAAGERPPVIIAFHQAESNHAEYAPIAPRLAQDGFTVLAIDQRSGDGAFGGTNLTVETLGDSTDYDEALPDLEAALAWAHEHADGAPVIAWGSSYSAALVFLLAARHADEVSAVVAFSPGEYLRNPTAVHDAARQLTMPVYIDQASSADEIAASTSILDAVGNSHKRMFMQDPSTHGASTLRADSNPMGNEAHWQSVLKFLAPFKHEETKR